MREGGGGRVEVGTQGGREGGRKGGREGGGEGGRIILLEKVLFELALIEGDPSFVSQGLF
jgi:hypothetical protein